MYMFKYVMKRLGLMLFTFIIIFTMCFSLIKLLEIPTNVLPGQDPEIVMKTLEGRGWITNIRKGANGLYEYDRVPIPIQFGNYIKRIVTQGDFGIATTYGEYVNMPVWEVFVSHLPPTILINIYSTLLGVPIGHPGRAQKEQVAGPGHQHLHNTAYICSFHSTCSRFAVPLLLQARLVPAENVNE